MINSEIKLTHFSRAVISPGRTDRQTDRLTDTRTDRQTHRHKDGRTDRQADGERRYTGSATVGNGGACGNAQTETVMHDQSCYRMHGAVE